MPAKRGKQPTTLTRWLMFSIADASGAFWAFHGATTSQMTKWWRDLNKWHYTTQWQSEYDLLVTFCDSQQTPSLAFEWIPEDGRRRIGRPRRTWQDTLKEDLNTLGVDWGSERYCKRSCQMETTRRPMFCSEREELSLSKCSYTNHVRWANYISSGCKFPTVYLRQKLWKLAGSRQSYSTNYQAYFFGPPCTYRYQEFNSWYVGLRLWDSESRSWSSASQSKLVNIVVTRCWNIS